MGGFLWLITASFVAMLLYFVHGVWRVHRGRAEPAPFLERISVAIIFGLVGWQGLDWLRVEHFAVHPARVFGIWVQLLCSFAISGLMITASFFDRRSTVSR